jgi:P27 family predicted phage terminase small subunit
MTEGQKAGWNYAVEHAPLGLLKKLDRSVLAAWVVAEDLHRRASEQVEKLGILTKAPNTGLPIQSPYLPVLNKQAQIILKAAEQLGFTPASRTRIQVEEPGNRSEHNPWADIG